MGPRIQPCLLLLFMQILVAAAETNSQDFAVLSSLKDIWKNTPPNWVNIDPCGNRWEGIGCTNGRVTSITLVSMGLTGQLSGDIASLSELQILDLSYNKGLTSSLPSSLGNLKKLTNLILVGCGFSGPIPSSIGSLTKLIFLSLNSNRFIGPIPPSIGSLPNLYWLDLADNQLSGTIPVSKGTTPGLDMLVKTKHFHFGKNQLTGAIPPQLFSSRMVLIHILLDSNKLTGSIPSTIGLVQSLEVIRLDRNSLSEPVPSNLNNLTQVHELHLSNNKLTGPVPDLIGMNLLNYVDMSNNSFDASDVPDSFSTLLSLTTIKMESTQLKGQIPTSLFSPPHLQTVVLSANQLNGTLDVGINHSSDLQLINLKLNLISGFTQRAGIDYDLLLLDNPICKVTGESDKFCRATEVSSSSYSTPKKCVPVLCVSSQISSPNCRCAYPYTGSLVFRAPFFSNLKNDSNYMILEQFLMRTFQSHKFPIDSVSLSNPFKDENDYLQLNLEVFPSEQASFNRTEISSLGFVLSNQTFKPPRLYGPFFFIARPYGNFSDMSTRSGGLSNTVIIATSAISGVSVLVLLLLCAGVYALRQRKRADRATELSNPFASWDPTKVSGGTPQLKGARFFSFEELKKCTSDFSEANSIGFGGYGKVYKGTLNNGQLVAIKRPQRDSMQGGLEFKTEIELLSRVHHKNLVDLVGFCFEHGEPILVYEYVANGTLKESLSGKSGVHMDWMRRLKVALGSARGLAYLHELANPPIIHRDVKSTNILLDERLTAKVADFGLSKLLADSEKSHVTTQVKGTMGYLDPEYYMTNQLTEKSDVYSFGVVMLELVTARSPIERGTYIVREVKRVMDKRKDLYNLGEILDPRIGTPLHGLERFVDLALRCVLESGSDRPTMGEVVKEIESIMEIAGLNPNAESASTSASYEEASKKKLPHPYINESLFDYTGGFPDSKVEPQ